jgi:DNA-binding NtrC family response regulator
MGKRILVVDDDEGSARSLARFFEGRGDSLDVAHEAEEAEALLQSAPYQLVVADVRLSGADSARGDIVACAKQSFAPTRVILLGEERDVEQHRAASRRKVDAFLHKPISLYALEALVDHFFRCAS